MIPGAVFVPMVGFAVGEVAERFKLPRPLGMLLAGMLVGPYALNLISPRLLDTANEFRVLALIIILLKAGLWLDKRNILTQIKSGRPFFTPHLWDLSLSIIGTKTAGDSAHVIHPRTHAMGQVHPNRKCVTTAVTSASIVHGITPSLRDTVP